MKRLKSLLSLALVLVMVLSFAVPAMASGRTNQWVPGAWYPITSTPTNTPAAPTFGTGSNYVAYLYCSRCGFASDALTIKDSVSVGTVKQDYYGDYYCEVTINPAEDLSVAVIARTHTVPNKDYTFTFEWVENWNGSGYWKQPRITFALDCIGELAPTGTYGITYKASGNWPYGVSVPTDYKSYKYGDKVTLQNPSKTVIADYVGGMPGYWVFNGWTVVSDNDYWYNNTSNKYNHSTNCGIYNGKWYCDRNCWYYDDYSYNCDHKYTWVDLDDDDNSRLVYFIKRMQEKGVDLVDISDSLNFTVTNNQAVRNTRPTTSTVTSGNIYLTKYCGHSFCTGEYCDVRCVCDHDNCPPDECYYWYNRKVCNHTGCTTTYCKYWDDCDYYNYYYGYYYPTQTITVTGNMTVYGSWSFQPAGGTLVISASTLAASEYTPESYTFEIYSANNSTKPVKTVTVKAGSNQYVSLDNGTYYIYAKNANVNGYDLDVTVSGDVSTDGAKIVMKGDAVQVKYSHLYTDGDLEFTTDHVAYLTGFSDGTIRPNDYITREQVATILYRLLTPESRAAYETTTNKFSDVKETRWSNTAISTLANAGVLGNTHSTFRPAENMTRAELINALVEITGVSGGRVAFSDTAGHWASSALNAAANEGWITGYADGTCEPDGFLTRAEVAVIINRVLDRNPGSVADLAEGMQTFTDNMKTTKWYYLDIQEAANGHTYKRDTDGSEYWTGLSK